MIFDSKSLNGRDTLPQHMMKKICVVFSVALVCLLTMVKAFWDEGSSMWLHALAFENDENCIGFPIDL